MDNLNSSSSSLLAPPSSRWTAWYTGLFCFYAVALTTSTAGMELAAALLSLSAVMVVVVGRMRNSSRRCLVLSSLRFFGDWLLWVFLGVIVAGAVFIPDLASHERREILRTSRFVLTLYALIIGLSVLALARPNRLSRVLKVLFVAAGLVGLYGFIQFFNGWDVLRSAPYETTIFSGEGPRFFRVKGFFTNTMSYSYIFGMLFCLILSSWYYGLVSFGAKWLLPVALFFIGSSLFMTFTRGLWIALFAAVLVMAFLIRKRYAAVILGATVSAIILLSVASEPFRNRLSGVVHLDQSNAERILIWKNHWAMFQDHPMLGVGFDQNARLMQEYNHKLYGKDWRVVHAHNHFLQVLTGVGVFGFLAFLGFSISMVVLAFKLWQKGVHDGAPAAQAIGLASLGAQTVFHVGGLSEAVFFDRESNHTYLFVVALTIVMWKVLGSKGSKMANEVSK